MKQGILDIPYFHQEGWVSHINTTLSIVKFIANGKNTFILLGFFLYFDHVLSNSYVQKGRIIHIRKFMQD